MEIESTTTHTVTFTVESFVSAEGGMNHETYGNRCNALADAILLLRAAEVMERDKDWVIVCNVQSSTTDQQYWS